ncbi:MAG TPA: ATP-binding protein [Gemmatimonadales bacterium]|nr:ATP-binding protein [Gemmatimonadales bacterium]
MALARRLAILTAVLALLLVLGATEIALSWSARSRLEDFRDDAVSLSTTLAALLSDVAPDGDPQLLSQGLEEWSLRRLGPTRRAWVYVSRAGTLSAVAASDTEEKAPDEADYQALTQVTTVVMQRGGRDPGWQVAAPLGRPEHPFGVLDIHVSTRRLEEWSRVERQRAYLAAVSAALLVALGVALLTRKWVGRPLAELGKAMAGAHGGAEGSPPAPEIGPHEFRLLARRYNRLRDALAERERESQARAALLALQERARGLDRLALVQETATAFAHEIGTPLNTVSGHLQLLRDDLRHAGQPDALDRVRLLLGQMDRVAGIVRAGLDRGRWPEPYVRTADLTEIAERILRFLEPAFNDAGVIARLEPTRAARPVAVCDPAQVEQILLNLLKNAIEALPPGGLVTVSTGAADGGVYVDVADDGPGLAPEAQANLFKPFATTKGAAGTGLGLAVSRRLARGLGGELSHLPASRGTRWRLSLPGAEPA